MINIKFGTGDFAGALFKFNAYNKDNSISCSFKLPNGQDNVREFNHLISCSKVEFEGNLLDQLILGDSCFEIDFEDFTLNFNKDVSDFNISSNLQISRNKETLSINVSNVNFDRLDMTLQYLNLLVNLMKNGDNSDNLCISDLIFKIKNTNDGLECLKKDTFLERFSSESSIDLGLLSFTKKFDSLSDTSKNMVHAKAPISKVSIENKDSRISECSNNINPSDESLMCNLNSRDKVLVNKLKNVHLKDYGLSTYISEKKISKNQSQVFSYNQIFLGKDYKYLTLLNKGLQLHSNAEALDYMSFVALTYGDKDLNVIDTRVRISSYAKFLLKNKTNLTTDIIGKTTCCSRDSKLLDNTKKKATKLTDDSFINKINSELNVNYSLKGINNGVNKLLINNILDLSKSQFAKVNIGKDEWVYKYIDGACSSDFCKSTSNSRKIASMLDKLWISESNNYLDFRDVIVLDNVESKPALINEYKDMLDSNSLTTDLVNQSSASTSGKGAYSLDNSESLDNIGEKCSINEDSQVSEDRTKLSYKESSTWLTKERHSLFKNKSETSGSKYFYNSNVYNPLYLSDNASGYTIVPGLTGLIKNGNETEKYSQLLVNKQGNKVSDDYFLKTLNFEQLNIGILNTKNLEGGGKDLSPPHIDNIGITTSVNGGYTENIPAVMESSDVDLSDNTSPLANKSAEDCAVYQVDDFKAHKYADIRIDSQKFGHVNDFVPPINILKGATDELQLPNSDFNYKKYEDLVFLENLNVSPKYLKGFTDDGDPIINLPLENPVTYFSNIAVNFISVDVRIMRKVLELLYNNWRRNIHRFAGVDPSKAMNKILEDTHSDIKEWYTSRTDVDRVIHAERSLKLFAWYCEMAILSHADYSIKYTRANAVFDFWSELPSFSIDKKEVVKGLNRDEIIKFSNFHYNDTKPYIVGSKPGALATLEISNVPQSCDTLLTFKAFIMGSGKLKVSTYNNAYDFVCKRNDVSITLPSDNNSFAITFIPSDDTSFVDISQFKILNRYNIDYELDYTGKVSNVNFTIQYILDVMTITGDSIEDASPVLKSSAPLAYALEKFKEYMEIHHNSKYKGKRLTIRNT